ncbi:hypothetical protein ACFLTP_04775 [Chloroflexota bacterium]
MYDKLDILHKMLVKPGTDISRSITFIQNEAKDRLKEFREKQGKEPDTFIDLVVFKDSEEASRIMGLSIDDAHDKDPNSYYENLIKLSNHEFTYNGNLHKNILNCSLYGLGFGSSFPELTVRMYEKPFKNININKWAEAWSYGLNIPEKPDIIPIEERENEILQHVATYTSEYYPELLDVLVLRDYLNI